MNFDYEQIGQYIEGKLEGEALAEFETKLLTDKALAEEVALYKDVNATLETAYAYEREDVELTETFNQLGKKYFAPETTATIEDTIKDTTQTAQDNTKVVPLNPVSNEREEKKSSNVRWLRPVVALAVAALIALLIFQPWQADVIRPFDSPYQLAIAERSGGEAELLAAEKAYNSGDYATALPVFEKYPDRVEAQLAKGNAQYYLGDADAAIRTFEQIASGGSVYVSTANWYLAGVHLQQNQPEKAKTALSKIKSGQYYDKAQNLLKELSK